MYKKEIIEALSRNYALVHDVFMDFGFNGTQAKNIIAAKDSVGASFSSASHNLYVDRAQFIIVPKSKERLLSVELYEGDSHVELGAQSITFARVDAADFCFE